MLLCTYMPGVHLLKNSFQFIAREFPVSIRAWNIKIIGLQRSVVTSDISLLVGPGCCTASLLDCTSSAEQNKDLDLGAHAGGLCARMTLPCIPSLDMSEERTDSAEQKGVGESVLVLDLLPSFRDSFKAWTAMYLYCISTNNQCQNPWYSSGVFSSF